MTVLIIVNSSKQTFPATSYLVAVFILMVGVAQKRRATISNLMAVLIIVVGPIRQDARAAKNLLHEIRSPFRKDGAGNGSCPIFKSLSPFLLLRVLGQAI